MNTDTHTLKSSLRHSIVGESQSRHSLKTVSRAYLQIEFPQAHRLTVFSFSKVCELVQVSDSVFALNLRVRP